jgi:hypothetical protein
VAPTLISVLRKSERSLVQGQLRPHETLSETDNPYLKWLWYSYSLCPEEALSLPSQNLLCWDMKIAQAPLLIHTFSSCHRDWITGCAWTKDNILVSEGMGKSRQGPASILRENNDLRLKHFLASINDGRANACWACT